MTRPESGTSRRSSSHPVFEPSQVNRSLAFPCSNSSAAAGVLHRGALRAAATGPRYLERKAEGQ